MKTECGRGRIGVRMSKEALKNRSNGGAQYQDEGFLKEFGCGRDGLHEGHGMEIGG